MHHAVQVAAILCGSPEALSQATLTWLELLAAQLQHLYPDLAFQTHLPTLMQRCLQAKGDADHHPLRLAQDLLEVRLCTASVVGSAVERTQRQGGLVRRQWGSRISKA